MSSPKQLVQWKQPSEMQLDAMFHPKRQTLAGLPYANGKMELPFFLTASLLNDIALSGIVTSTDAYELFKTIPSGEVLRSLQAIAAPILDALRERIFFAALNAGDADIVRAMLELGVNPSEKIMTRMPYPSFELTLVCPLEFSVASRHFLVAKTLISHLCRDATPSQADELLGHVLKAIQKERYQYPEQEIERTELICIALAAGASPVQECLGNNSYAVPLSSVQQFIEAGATEVAAWLQVGLLDLYLDTHYGVQESQDHRERLAQEVLRFILSENMHRIPPGNPHVRQVLLQAARCALLARHVWAVGIILQGFESLGYHLDDNLARKDVTGDSVVQACASGHWELAESYVTAPTRHPVTVPARHPETASEANLVPKIDLEEQLEQIILENDITSICDFWSDLLRKSPEQGLSIVEKSVKLGYYQMAIATIQRLEDEFKMGLQGLVVLMQHAH
ncbi:hypothetical protein CC86DRAFT_347409 [Ophiobolus disseminans]|uniref:Uncharacterized protein n=1 Tax=Ophiobolus disseminans TaxID=1469910 RepID=A0A6A7A7Y9_9PLEO|nr:hypothetical protein CC86DRAFT_347409 [Ophiobolus disseminans]